MACSRRLTPCFSPFRTHERQIDPGWPGNPGAATATAWAAARSMAAPAPRQNLILDRLTRRYAAMTLVDGVRLSIGGGELLALPGPSG